MFTVMLWDEKGPLDREQMPDEQLALTTLRGFYARARPGWQLTVHHSSGTLPWVIAAVLSKINAEQAACARDAEATADQWDHR